MMKGSRETSEILFFYGWGYYSMQVELYLYSRIQFQPVIANPAQLEHSRAC